MTSPSNGADTAPDCLFCKIVSGVIPSRRIYEDDHAVACRIEVVPEVERHRGVGRRQPRGGGNRRHV